MIQDIKVFTLRLFYPAKAPERREVSANFSKECDSQRFPIQVKPLSRYTWKLFACLDTFFITRLHSLLRFVGLIQQQAEPTLSDLVFPLYARQSNREDVPEEIKKGIFDHRNSQRYQVVYKPNNPFSLVSEETITKLCIAELPEDDLPFQGYAAHPIQAGMSIPLSLYQLFACVKLEYVSPHDRNKGQRGVNIDQETQIGKIHPAVDPSQFEKGKRYIDDLGRSCIDPRTPFDWMTEEQFIKEQRQVAESIKEYVQNRNLTSLKWKDANTMITDLLSSLDLTDHQKENIRKAIALEWRTSPHHRIFYRASNLDEDSCIGLLQNGIKPYSLSFQSSIFGGLYGKDATSFTFERGGDLYALVLPKEKATKYFYAPNALWEGILSMVTRGEYGHPRVKVTEDTYGGNFLSDPEKAPTIAKFTVPYSLSKLSRRIQKLYSRHLHALYIMQR